MVSNPFQPTGSNCVRSEHFGLLQELIDVLYRDEFEGMTEAERIAAQITGKTMRVRRLDVVIAAESLDFPDELQEVVDLLPPGQYTRAKLCNQLNSIVCAHAWGQVFGTVS